VLLMTGALAVLLPSGGGRDVMPVARAQTSFNYAEALQKAIFFYEAQVSGAKPSWSRNTWRGDSAMDDGDDAGIDLTGGWFDAGDHVKFGFAMASSATMLAWAAVQNGAAMDAEGQLVHLRNNLRVATDYFIKAHSAPSELWGQVGIGGNDHAFWGSAEVMHLETTRASFRIHAGCGGSDLAAETAAAMAAASIVFRPVDAPYANTLVTHARQLFAFAEATHPSFYVDCINDAAGFYNSRFGNPNDEMAWAAVWLHKATGEAAFLTRARALYGTMCKESGTNTPCFTWSQSWNDKHFGVYVLMAQLTGEPQFHADAQRWLDYWTVGAGATSRTTAGGLMFVHNFGSLRYATNLAFLALAYADLLGPAHPLYARYHGFAKRQVDYALGANPRNSSYVCGFGTNPPRNPHHRTAHGTWTNNPTGVPNPSVHTLYGGLVGGPDAQDDFSWSDDRNLFMRTEVATDFNAGLVGALARLAQEFGGNPLPNFPPVESPGLETFVDARIQDNQPSFTTIQALIRNRSAWPARVLTQASFRYYFTLEPGVTPAQIQVSQFTSECGGNAVSGPTLLSGSTYFVTVSCPATIAPTGESDHRREVQFRLTGPSDAGWDPANDHSFQGLTPALSPAGNIQLFNAGVPIFGTPPTTGPDFALSANPTAASVTQGGTSATSTLTVTRSGGFTGAVTLSASGQPAGVTVTFSPNPVIAGASTATFTASASAVTGTFPLTVSGTAAGITGSRTTTVTLTVNAPQTPNFSLSATPTAVTATQGGAAAATTITVARTGGFAGAVTLAATGQPTGVTVGFSPNPANGGTSTATFTASGTATTGTFPVTISGAAPGISGSRTTTVTLTVSASQPGNGGVTVSTATGGSPPWYFEDRLSLNNTSTVTAMTITVVAQRTPGVTFNGLYNTVGFAQGNTGNSNPATITYTWTLSGQMGPGTGRLFVAQMNGTGTPHPSSGDTWTVTYTVGGQSFSQSGTF
jgi:endoglucanase